MSLTYLCTCITQSRYIAIISFRQKHSSGEAAKKIIKRAGISSFLLIQLLTFSFSSAHAQNWIWGRQPISKNGGGGENTLDHSIATDKAGDLYTTGGFFDKLIYGTDTLSSVEYDVFLARYDFDGNLLWATGGRHSTSSSAYSMAYSVATDNMNDAYITGGFRDTLILGTDTLVPDAAFRSGILSVFIAKCDSNGNFLWVKKASTPWGNGSSMAVDRQGNSYITGFYSDTLVLGTDTLKSAFPFPNFNVFVAKYDANGNELWARQSVSANPTGNGFGQSVAIDGSGNPYITGYITGSASFGSHAITAGSTEELFLVKYDTNGNIIWVKNSVNTASCESSSLAIDCAGSIYVTGFFTDSVLFGADTLISNVHTANMFLTKYDTGGNVHWAKQTTVLDGYPCAGYSLACDTLKRGGGYAVIGNYTGATSPSPFKLSFASDTFSLNTSYQTAALMLQFDSAGNVVCGSMFSDGDEDDGDVTAVDPSGQHIFVGGDLFNQTIIGPDTLSNDASLQTIDIPYIARWRAFCCKIPIAVIPLDTDICMGGSVILKASGADSSYTWSPTSGLSSATGAMVIATPTINIKYTVLGADSSGCAGTATATINVHPIPSVLLNPRVDSICPGDSARIMAFGSASYTWFPSSGLSCNNCFNPNVSPSAPTTYTVVGVSSFGCTDTAKILIKINPLPNAAIIPTSNTICFGDSTTLTATGGGSYLWSNNATSSSIKVSPASAATYFVVVNNGCIDSAKTRVAVDVPLLTVCCNDTIKTGDTVHLNANDAITYSWSPASSLSCSDCPDPVASPSVTTTYTVTGTDDAGCSLDRTITINTEIPCADFTIPNVFTPNNDGINDDFVINVLNASSYNITIYDRWGKQVFTSDSPTVYWNGRINSSNNLAPDGVYYYIINASCSSNNYSKKGFVQIIGEN